jgi:hypothetical protein
MQKALKFNPWFVDALERSDVMALVGFSYNPVVGSAGYVDSASSKSSVGSTAYQQSTAVEKQASATVSISGKAIMLSRLFGSDGSVEQKLETATTTSNTSGSVYNFLTRNDREMLSTVYEYANSNKIDPLKVDGLAVDLAIYRMAGAGGPMDSAGKLYDTQGNPFIPQFNAEDEAVAQRVLTSKAMSDTLIDRGFLDAIFSPTRMSVHASDFSFLEDVVYAFSVSGSDGATDPNAKPVVRYSAENFSALNVDGQALVSGNETMLSRLMDKELAGNIGALSVQSMNSGLTRLLDLLSNNDKTMLGKLYFIGQSKGENLLRLDDIAVMLGNYRKIGLGA